MPILRMWMLGVLFAAAGAKACLVEYQIDFTVDSALNRTYGDFSTHGHGGFSYKPEMGDVFSATIGFDDSILGMDGSYAQVSLDNFRLELAGLVWDPGDPSSQFYGFRGLGLGSKSPILEIRDHELAGLLGDVYGSGDYPFADFRPDGSFSSVDLGNNVLVGTMQVAGKIPSVPEPSPIIFFAMAVSLMALRTRIFNT